MTDNWKNRAKGRVCATCIHFVDKAPIKGKLVLGRCRRHAPVVQEGYPVVFQTDACGDHKLDENAV